MRVWRAQEDRYRQDCIRPKKKFNKSVMMWMCIAANGSSTLLRCENTQNSLSYQQRILTPSLNFLRHRSTTRRRADPIVFMQDGASSHTSQSTLRFLRTNNIQFIPDWPPNSPDLNPVEHCWAWLARQLVGKSFSTEDELEAAVQETWRNRPASLIPNLYGSMVRRMTAVMVAKGGPTRY